jgi:chemotaxis protein MotB
MKLSRLIFAAMVCTLVSTSCVSKKVLKSEQDRVVQLQADQSKLQDELKNCNTLTAEANQKNASLQSELDNLRKQNEFLKENNNQALKQLENLSVISSSQAESIKKSLDNIGAKDSYIQSLQSALNRKTR